MLHTARQTVPLREQWMVAAVLLAHANQLLLARL